MESSFGTLDKEKMTEKSKAIWPAAAKKTIEKLENNKETI